MTVLTNDLKDYLQAAHCGKENAIISRHLEKVFNCNGVELRHAVNKLRQNGVPICSSQYGYYYAANEQEIIETIMQLKRRAMGIQSALNGLETNLISLDF